MENQLYFNKLLKMKKKETEIPTKDSVKIFNAI